MAIINRSLFVTMGKVSILFLCRALSVNRKDLIGSKLHGSECKLVPLRVIRMKCKLYAQFTCILFTFNQSHDRI